MVFWRMIALRFVMNAVCVYQDPAKEKEAADLRKKYFGPEGEGMKKRQELITPIQDAIYNAIKDIATQKNYDAVIDRASAQSMIFASPRIDISNEVLAKLGYSN